MPWQSLLSLNTMPIIIGLTLFALLWFGFLERLMGFDSSWRAWIGMSLLSVGGHFILTNRSVLTVAGRPILASIVGFLDPLMKVVVVLACLALIQFSAEVYLLAMQWQRAVLLVSVVFLVLVP